MSKPIPAESKILAEAELTEQLLLRFLSGLQALNDRLERSAMMVDAMTAEPALKAKSVS